MSDLEKTPQPSERSPEQTSEELVAETTQKLRELKAERLKADTKSELEEFRKSVEEANDKVQAHLADNPNNPELQSLQGELEQLETEATQQSDTAEAVEEIKRVAAAVAPTAAVPTSTLGRLGGNISSAFSKVRDFLAKTFGKILPAIRQSLQGFVDQPFVKEWMPWLGTALSSIGLVESLVGKARMNLFSAAERVGVTLEAKTDEEQKQLETLLTTINKAGMSDNELFFNALLGKYVEANGQQPVNIAALTALVTPAFIADVKATMAAEKPDTRPEATSATPAAAAATTPETEAESPDSDPEVIATKKGTAVEVQVADKSYVFETKNGNIDITGYGEWKATNGTVPLLGEILVGIDGVDVNATGQLVIQPNEATKAAASSLGYTVPDKIPVKTAVLQRFAQHLEKGKQEPFNPDVDGFPELRLEVA